MRYILLALFALTLTSVNAQTSKEDLLKTYDDYMVVVSTLDVDSTLDYIYPKLFEIVPREALFEAMDESFSDPSIELSISKDSLHTISDIVVFDSVHYATIDYSYLMQMRYLDEEDYTSEEDGIDVFGFTKDMLEEEYGPKNVLTDTVQHSFSIDVKAQMFAIYNPEYNAWKFLENKIELSDLIDLIVDEKAVKHFKKKMK